MVVDEEGVLVLLVLVEADVPVVLVEAFFDVSVEADVLLVLVEVPVASENRDAKLVPE